MSPRTEAITHEDRHRHIINYLLVAVIKYKTKPALRTRVSFGSQFEDIQSAIMVGRGSCLEPKYTDHVELSQEAEW